MENEKFTFEQFPRILGYYRGIPIIENLNPDDDKVYILNTSNIKFKKPLESSTDPGDKDSK
jgi:hypothetical protein